MDVFELSEGLQSWIQIDALGNSQVLEIDKLSIICRCGISIRDLRILDPLFVYPITILGREKAIIANMEKIRCIITADEVLLLNSHDRNVLQYVMELQKRLITNSEAELNPIGSSSRSLRSTSSYVPFEFRALAVALGVISGLLNFEASEIKAEAHPLLDELTSHVSASKLERIHRLKCRLVALTRKVHKIKDEIGKIMDDKVYMAEMYLTEKKRKMESSTTVISDHDLSSLIFDEGPFETSDDPIMISRVPSSSESETVLTSGASSPSESRRLTKNLSGNVFGSRRKSSMMSLETRNAKSVEELESLLEAYFVAMDSIFTKLITLKENIHDTENFINIQLNNHRNRLIQFGLLFTTATFVMAIFAIIMGTLGINYPKPLFSDSRTVELVLIIITISGIVLYCALVSFFKWRRVLLL